MLRRRLNAGLIVALVLGLVGCEAAQTNITPDEARAIAEEAYIFGYPMLLNHQIMYMQAINEGGQGYFAPFNRFTHLRQRLTADFRDVVGPNNNTLYSLAWLDLRAEPVILSIPPIDGERFYVHQIVDMFTHNFAYVGARATGFGGGQYLITGPDWNGAVPEGITYVFRSEGQFVIVLGRTYVASDDEVPLGNTIQEQYTLQALSEFAGSEAPAAPTTGEIPPYSVEGDQTADFIGALNFLLAHVEQHPSEKALYQRFEKIGIRAGKPFDSAALDPGIRGAIDEGVAAALHKISAHAPTIGRKVNGWNNFAIAFGDREQMQGRYLDRAAAAMVGIYGNNPEENNTFTAFLDGDGEPMNGSQNDYVIHFPAGQLPPTKGFWSVTMYDAEAFMVKNEIDRFSVWGEDPMLKYGDDGSLTIYLQHRNPGPGKASNWLPAPDASFGLALRNYWPKESVAEGSWDPPPVQKAN